MIITKIITAADNGTGLSRKNGENPAAATAAIQIIIIILKEKSIFDLKVIENPLFLSGYCHCKQVN